MPADFSNDFSKRHSLLMFSGGIDSLSVLYQVNREGRHRAETVACGNIVAWCTEHLRSFRYTESTIDHSAFELFGRDVLLVAFEAGSGNRDAARPSAAASSRPR